MDQANPYRPPEAEVDGPSASMSGELASRGARFGTFVVDYIGYIAMSFAVGALIALVFGETGTRMLQNTPDILLGVVLMMAYYVFFESLWGRTPGKFVFGTKVTDMKGGKPGLGTTFVRTLCRFIPFEPLSFFGKEGWHDSMSKTRVVRVR